MTRKQSTKKGGTKGKAEGSRKAKAQRAADGEAVTAERLRAFLANPDVKETVKERVRKLVGELYEAGEWDTLPEEPEMYMLEFQQTYINDHMKRGTAEPAEREIYEKLVAVVNRHEPKDVRLVRRLSELLRDPKTPDEVFNRLGDLMCNLSGETQVDDLHPEVFATLARVYIRVAREGAAAKVGNSEKARREWLKKNEKGRRALSGRSWMFKKYLDELEAIAAGE
jgi:hypothetical protein